MSEQFPGLTIAYQAGNAAHRIFRAALANAKALAYVLAQKDATILREFLVQAEEAKRMSSDGNFAIVMAGARSTPTSVQAAILLS
jgi:hypothetical protein